jgi:hypothetical protein
MNAIRIRKTIESETLHLPELKPLIGQTVEIIVLQGPQPGPVHKDWQPLVDAAGQGLIDPEVSKQYREFDRQQQIAPEL